MDRRRARLKMEDEIGCNGELRMSAASIVCRLVICMFEAQFRADLDGGADPFGDTQCVLCVLCGIAEALTAAVVDGFREERQENLRRERLHEIIHDGVLRRCAAQQPYVTACSICTELGRDGI